MGSGIKKKEAGCFPLSISDVIMRYSTSLVILAVEKMNLLYVCRWQILKEGQLTADVDDSR